MLESGEAKSNKCYLLTTVVASFTQINSWHHKLGKYYFIMIACFSAAPHLRQVWTTGGNKTEHEHN